MGTSGCVSWSFDKKGVIIVDNEDGKLDEDVAMMDALEAGADDFTADGPVFQVTTEPEAVSAVAEALSGKYQLLSAQAELVPQTYITLTDEGDIKNMRKMLDMFEDNDDIQNIYHNWENEDAE